MEVGLDLKISLDGDAKAMAAKLAATERDIQQAVDRSLRTLMRWIRTHALREIGKEVGVKAAPLKKRFFLKVRSSADGASTLWVGLNPIGLHYFGQPRQTIRGVQVKDRVYSGAFINSMRSTDDLVWKRAGSERLPIEMVTEEIDETAKAVLERFERRAMDRFMDLLSRQLKHEVLRG